MLDEWHGTVKVFVKLRISSAKTKIEKSDFIGRRFVQILVTLSGHEDTSRRTIIEQSYPLN